MKDNVQVKTSLIISSVMFGSSNNTEMTEMKIAPIFLGNNISAQVVIPIEFARKYGIDKPTHVTLEDTGNGILIKKLELKK